MAGIIVYTHIASNRSTLILYRTDIALKAMEKALDEGRHFSSALSHDWKDGRDAFEIGIVEEWDDLSRGEEIERMDSWREAMEDVEVWITEDGWTGDEQ